ncbi:transposase [Streptomyces minutiscleroticus]
MPAPRKYPLELRERAVRMYRTAEPKPVIRRMAEELGVHHEALRGWIRQAEADAGERVDLLTSDERAELAALRKENTQLKRSNEILRTASAFFASMPQWVQPGGVRSFFRCSGLQPVAFLAMCGSAGFLAGR